MRPQDLCRRQEKAPQAFAYEASDLAPRAGLKPGSHSVRFEVLTSTERLTHLRSTSPEFSWRSASQGVVSLRAIHQTKAPFRRSHCQHVQRIEVTRIPSAYSPTK